MRFDVPVTPDAEQAREWARDELSKPEYAEQGTSWFETFLEWVVELFNSIEPIGGDFGALVTVALVVLALAIVAFVIWLVMGPLRRSRRSQVRGGMLQDDERSSQQMRDAARAAERVQDWDTAVMEWYRASVRRMEERGRIADSPGATAREAAYLIAGAAPSVARDAATSAHSFDVARYGSGGLRESDAAQARDFFETLATAPGGSHGEVDDKSVDDAAEVSV